MKQEYSWSVRVRSAGADDCTAYARRHRLQIGAPLSFDQEYTQATSLEHSLAAVGSDIVNGLHMRARRRRIQIDNVEATVECQLNNPLTFLEVIGEEGNPGISELRVVAYISTLAPDNEIDSLWRDTLLRSPLVQTLQGAVTMDLRYKIVL